MEGAGCANRFQQLWSAHQPRMVVRDAPQTRCHPGGGGLAGVPNLTPLLFLLTFATHCERVAYTMCIDIYQCSARACIVPSVCRWSNRARQLQCLLTVQPCVHQDNALRMHAQCIQLQCSLTMQHAFDPHKHWVKRILTNASASGQAYHIRSTRIAHGSTCFPILLVPTMVQRA